MVLEYLNKPKKPWNYLFVIMLKWLLIAQHADPTRN